MKKVLIFLSIVSLVSLVNLTNAQNIDPCMNYDWVNNSGGGSHDFSEATVADEFGNQYVVGRFMGSETFGSQTLNSTGQSDVFVGKMDSLGQWLWVRQGKGTETLNGNSIELDNTGNLYISGSFYGDAVFGTDSVFSSKIYADAFVAKLDTSGNWLWVREAGGNNHDYGYGLEVDLSGNVYLTGRVGGLANFGGTTTGTQYRPGTTLISVTIFVIKLDSAGNWIWATSSEDANQGTSSKLISDASGELYVVGHFQDNIVFGSTQLTGNGKSDCVISKIDSSGNWLWAKSFGGSSWDITEAVTLDGQGNIFIGGSFESTVDFGMTTQIANGNTDIFLSKMNASGNFIWTKTAGGSAADALLDLETNSQGDVFATGHFSETASFGSHQAISEGMFDIFISKVDASGNWIWTKTAGSDLADDGRSVAVDIYGNVYVAGYFQGGLSFDQHALNSNGGYDVFNLRMTSKIMDLAPMTGVVADCGNAIFMPGQAMNYATALWTPSTGLNDPSMINSAANLLQSTEYTLTVTDGCGQTLSEKVQIDITPLQINAGSDATVSQGTSVQLDAQINNWILGTQFLWKPGTGLNDSTTQTPIATPQITTTYIVRVTMPSGCTNTDTITINIIQPNALEETRAIGAFNVYPNPASNFVHVIWQINSAEPVHCEIINQQGQVIQKQVFESGNEAILDVHGIQAGFYWIQLTQGTISHAYKLVKTQ